MSARMALEPAWVLHARPYRETSSIAELLTATQGRVGVVVRGARGSRRGSGNAIRQFAPLLVSWSGRGSLKSLTAAENDGKMLLLQGDALLAGIYLNELLLRVLKPFDAHEDLFPAYGGCLRRIAAGEALAPVLRQFEKDLLVEIGYAVSFSHSADDALPIEPAGEYVLVQGSGFVRVERAPSGIPGERLPGATLLCIGAGDYAAAETRRIARNLFRLLLEPYLGGYPLQSSRLLAASRSGTERSQADA